MNITKLNVKLAEIGMSKIELAKRVGVSPQALYKKINGNTKLKIEDLELFKNALNATEEEIKEIFLI